MRRASIQKKERVTGECSAFKKSRGCHRASGASEPRRSKNLEGSTAQSAARAEKTRREGRAPPLSGAKTDGGVSRQPANPVRWQSEPSFPKPCLFLSSLGNSSSMLEYLVVVLETHSTAGGEGGDCSRVTQWSQGRLWVVKLTAGRVGSWPVYDAMASGAPLCCRVYGRRGGLGCDAQAPGAPPPKAKRVCV